MTNSSSTTGNLSALSYFCQGPDDLYNRLESLVNSEEGLLQSWCSSGGGDDEDTTDEHTLVDLSSTVHTKKKKDSMKKNKMMMMNPEAPHHLVEAIHHHHQQQLYLNSQNCSSLLDEEENYDGADMMNEYALYETCSIDGSVESQSHAKFKIVASSGDGVVVDNYHHHHHHSTTTTTTTTVPITCENNENHGPSTTTTGVYDEKEEPIPTNTNTNTALPLHLQRVILQEEIMEELQEYLPWSKQGESFWLLYSLTRDGASLDLLLDKVQDAETTLLAIETLDGEVFGAFCTQSWKRSHDYYGSGQSFLWRKSQPSSVSVERNPEDMDPQQQHQRHHHHHRPVQVFSFAYNNHNVQLVTQHSMIVGGSGGGISEYHQHHFIMGGGIQEEYSFGLWLDHDLSRGSSSPCSTFCSPSLSLIHADGSAFEIANIEIWALTPCINLEQAKTAMDNKRLLAGHLAPSKVTASWMHTSSSPAPRRRGRRRRTMDHGNSTAGGGGSSGNLHDDYCDDDEYDEEPVSLFGSSTVLPLASGSMPPNNTTSSKKEETALSSSSR